MYVSPLIFYICRRGWILSTFFSTSGKCLVRHAIAYEHNLYKYIIIILLTLSVIAVGVKSPLDPPLDYRILFIVT